MTPLSRHARCSLGTWPECSGPSDPPPKPRRTCDTRDLPSGADWAPVFKRADRRLHDLSPDEPTRRRARASALFRIGLLVFTELGRRRADAERRAKEALADLNALSRDHEAWFQLCRRLGEHAAAAGTDLESHRMNDWKEK